MAIIIKTGTKEETSVQIAQKILKMNTEEGSDKLSFLRSLTIEQLKEIKGIGRVKAIQIKALCELGIRMSKPSYYKKIKIKEPYDLAKILLSELRSEKREIVKVVILNSKNEILKILDVANGGSNFANVTMKEILSEAIKMKAPKIMLVHNHPSGSSTPSKTDINFTNKLYDVAELLGIKLLDHLVIGNMEYTSIFSEMIK